jgi:hypothetical protein
MTTRHSRLVIAALIGVAAAGAMAAAQGDSFLLKVNKAAGMDIFMGMDRTKTPVATTGSDGSASLPLDFLNDAALKPRMSVARQECKGTPALHILRSGSDDDRRCGRGETSDGCGRCAIVGYFNWGRNTTIGGPLHSNPAIWVAAGGILAGAVGVAQRGGGNGPAPTPSGNQPPASTPGSTPTPTPTPEPTVDPVVRRFRTNMSVLVDPSAHNEFVGYLRVLQATMHIFSTGRVRIEGDAPWVALEGTLTAPLLEGAGPTSGTLSARGTGTVAGRSGVLVVFEPATLNAAGELSGTLTIGGAGGTPLPNNPITYRLTGTEIR